MLYSQRSLSGYSRNVLERLYYLLIQGILSIVYNLLFSSCTVAEVNLAAFDDEVLVLPDGAQLTKKNDIQEPLSRYFFSISILI